MPNGFAGSAAVSYLTHVEEAHTNAAASVAGAAIQNRPQPRVQRLPFSPDEAQSESGRSMTGTGRHDNIVADLTTYEAIAWDLYKADECMGQCLYDVCGVIEEMLRSSYILPRTVPQCMDITNDIKHTLREYRESTDTFTMVMRRFARDITEV